MSVRLGGSYREDPVTGQVTLVERGGVDHPEGHRARPNDAAIGDAAVTPATAGQAPAPAAPPAEGTPTEHQE
jgi:hypothetical protein